MKKMMFVLAFLFSVVGFADLCAGSPEIVSAGTISGQSSAATDYLQPIRPGVIGEKPFWNAHSFTFKYVPAFEFKFVDNAVEYLFAATSHTGQVHRFTAQRPDAPLTPIWDDLPVGRVILRVMGFDAGGNRVGIPLLRQLQYGGRGGILHCSA